MINNLNAGERYSILSKEDREKFDFLRGVMLYIIAYSRAIKPENQYVIVRAMHYIEYEMQKVLGFKPNSNWHYYDLKLSGCTCPKLDNYECLGHGRITSEDCPVHGKHEKDIQL